MPQQSYPIAPKFEADAALKLHLLGLLLCWIFLHLQEYNNKDKTFKGKYKLWQEINSLKSAQSNVAKVHRDGFLIYFIF